MATTKVATPKKLDITSLRSTLESLKGTDDLLITQKEVDPALELAAEATTNELVTGARAKGRERMTDDMLRGQIIAMRWMLGQVTNAKTLLEQLEQVDKVRQETEPASEGGSPYA